MRLLLDETGLVLAGGEEDDLREQIEGLLDALDRAHTETDPVVCCDGVYYQEVMPGVPLCDLLYGHAVGPGLVEALRRLSRAIDKMPRWDAQDTPPALEVTLEGQTREASSLAWGWARASEGEAVGCVVCVAARRAGELEVSVGGVPRRLFFIGRPEDAVTFFRRSVLIEDVSAEVLWARRERAFPTLLWRDGAYSELRTHKASFFRAHTETTVRHLAALDDHGARIFSEQTEQAARARHLSAKGVTASSENSNAKSNAEARRQHTRLWRGRDVLFWWHTKITHNDGRIHFLHEPPGEPPSEEHPHGRIVIGIFAGHLEV